jgi:hypothetical protein
MWRSFFQRLLTSDGLISAQPLALYRWASTTTPTAGQAAAITAPAAASSAALAPIAMALVKRVPTGSVMLLQTLYGSLSVEERRTMRKGGYPSLLLFLKEARHHNGILALSHDGLRCTKLGPGMASTDGSIMRLLNPVEPPKPPPQQHQHNGVRKFATPLQTFSASEASGLSENLWEIFDPPVLQHDQLPPAPHVDDMDRSERRVHQKIGVGHAGVFTAEMLVPYLPTFFVPMSELLHVLPEGYTADHIEGIFTGTKTVEVVTLEGEKFVRMHGGSTVNLGQSGEANARFPQYEPDPTLCDAIAPLFERPYRWYPLRAIVEGLHPAVLQRFPYARYKSLLFFAQMQHRFQFAPDGEGEVCAVKHGDNLAPHSTPTPQALSEVMEELRTHESLTPDELVEGLSRSSLVSMVLYYNDGGLDEFLHLHRGLFELCSVRRMIELKSTAEARRRKNRTLEEKLEDALANNEKRDVRKIRRKIAIARNPNNPLIDRDHLVLELKKFLPKTRHISFRSLTRNLPPDMIDLFPSDQISLFRNTPQHFHVFEFKVPGRLHIMRAELPLPPGHLRQDYKEEELIHLCTLHLARHPRLMVDVFSRLPWGAREIVRTRYKGLFHLLAKYPQYFAIVFKDGKQKYDSRGAMVSLVGQPPPLMMEDESTLLGDGPKVGDDEDEEVLQEVQQQVAAHGYKVPTKAARQHQQSDDHGGDDECTADDQDA